MSKRVLVVEDEEDIRRLVSIKLKGAGYEVATASDGEEGLAAALRDDEATRNLPVVMMTASRGMSASDRSAIDQLGASVLLHKPSSAEELAELIGHGLTKGPG